ncbi:CAP domain-containing protein [Lishizhenia sp.]|uniref:CAP domain-containing protein n=1 Tax=Lishizhenia sp. TaxID=2497594 RepID=UPI00299CDDBA|nr:CAP domain-containing protein [Lishizhenia sp.]MDX1445718.1 CAP domain-containing protein [Lishizhenia sp.]
MKKFLTTLLVLITFLGIGQNSFTAYQKALLEEVNTLRDSLKLAPLELDQTLNLAADDQNYFLKNAGKLTHFQPTFGKETPSERILFHQGNRTYAGENVAFREKAKKENLTPDSLALLFFLEWKNSPAHYQNMINPNFTKMGVSLFSTKNRYYSTQVFSSDEIELPNEFDHPDLSWGVRKAEFNCKTQEHLYETMFFGNHTQIIGNEIYLVYHDMEFFKGVIHAPNDGFAVDIVLREQFPCDQENQLHLSDVYDGEMQRPIYNYDLLKNDISGNPYKLKTKIGEVPTYLKDKQWSANIIVINDNKLCDYTIPTRLSTGIYPLLDIEPFIDYSRDIELDGNPDTVLVKDSLVAPFPFLRSDSTLRFFNSYGMKVFQDYYHLYDTIWVEVYASVEGKTWFNEQLLSARKEAIEKVLGNYLRTYKPRINYVLTENWDMMYKQINDLNINELKGLTKPEIKSYLKRHPSDFYDSLLYAQRVCYLHAYIDKELEVNTQEKYLFSKYFDSTLSVRNLPWQILLPEQIENRQVLNSSIFDSLYTEERLKTNLLNIGSMYNSGIYYDSLSVENFVKKVDTNNTYQLFNYIHFLTQYWYGKHAFSMSLENVANTPSPALILGYMELLRSREDIDTLILNRLELNVLLAGIHRYNAINDWKKEKVFFKEIVKRAKSSNLNAQEALELALFCNYFHEFKISVELLDYYYKQGLLTENGIFVLAETAYLVKESLPDLDYISYFMAAKNANKTRYCKWLDEYFQIQRHEVLKRDFCKSCL